MSKGKEFRKISRNIGSSFKPEEWARQESEQKRHEEILNQEVLPRIGTANVMKCLAHGSNDLGTVVQMIAAANDMEAEALRIGDESCRTLLDPAYSKENTHNPDWRKMIAMVMAGAFAAGIGVYSGSAFAGEPVEKIYPEKIRKAERPDELVLQANFDPTDWELEQARMTPEITRDNFNTNEFFEYHKDIEGVAFKKVDDKNLAVIFEAYPTELNKDYPAKQTERRGEPQNYVLTVTNNLLKIHRINTRAEIKNLEGWNVNINRKSLEKISAPETSIMVAEDQKAKDKKKEAGEKKINLEDVWFNIYKSREGEWWKPRDATLPLFIEKVWKNGNGDTAIEFRGPDSEYRKSGFRKNAMVKIGYGAVFETLFNCGTDRECVAERFAYDHSNNSAFNEFVWRPEDVGVVPGADGRTIDAIIWGRGEYDSHGRPLGRFENTGTKLVGNVDNIANYAIWPGKTQNDEWAGFVTLAKWIRPERHKEVYEEVPGKKVTPEEAAAVGLAPAPKAPGKEKVKRGKTAVGISAYGGVNRTGEEWDVSVLDENGTPVIAERELDVTEPYAGVEGAVEVPIKDFNLMLKAGIEGTFKTSASLSGDDVTEKIDGQKSVGYWGGAGISWKNITIEGHYLGNNSEFDMKDGDGAVDITKNVDESGFRIVLSADELPLDTRAALGYTNLSGDSKTQVAIDLRELGLPLENRTNNADRDSTSYGGIVESYLVNLGGGKKNPKLGLIVGYNATKVNEGENTTDITETTLGAGLKISDKFKFKGGYTFRNVDAHDSSIDYKNSGTAWALFELSLDHDRGLY